MKLKSSVCFKCEHLVTEPLDDYDYECEDVVEKEQIVCGKTNIILHFKSDHYDLTGTFSEREISDKCCYILEHCLEVDPEVSNNSSEMTRLLEKALKKNNKI